MSTEALASMAIGVLIVTGFGALWVSLGVKFLGHLDWRTTLAIAAITLLLCFGAFRQLWQAASVATAYGTPTIAFSVSGRQFGVILAFEWIPILGSVLVFRRIGRRDLILPTIALIVGLHFAPLAWLFRAPQYYYTAAAITASALASFWVREATLRQAIACLGCGAALWLTAAISLIR